MVKAVLAGNQSPYSATELGALAEHCTAQEDAAEKVERRMRKYEAALLLESHVGQQYDAIVTGSSDSGLWVRIFAPPAEGRLESGPRGLEVGQQIRVKLVSTDVERGFIDFVVDDRMANPGDAAVNPTAAGPATGRLQHPIRRVR